MLGLTFHPAVCSPHKVGSVHMSISGYPGLHATGQGTARASMFPTQDLGTLIWLRATRWGRRAGELHWGGCSHLRFWSGTGQLLGAFLFFKSWYHWIVSPMSSAKPRMARSPGPGHALPVRRPRGNKLGAQGYLGSVGSEHRKMPNRGVGLLLGTACWGSCGYESLSQDGVGGFCQHLLRPSLPFPLLPRG